jgi:hypothetical protein
VFTNQQIAVVRTLMAEGLRERSPDWLSMPRLSGVFIENCAKTFLKETQPPMMALCKSLDLLSPLFPVVRPNPFQIRLVNSAVLGCSQLGGDITRQLSHSLIWLIWILTKFDAFCQ